MLNKIKDPKTNLLKSVSLPVITKWADIKFLIKDHSVQEYQTHQGGGIKG